MQRMRCVGRGNRPCSLPDVGICFCGRPLGAVLTQGVSGSGEDAPSNSSGDYVCRQFELLYPEEPHTSYLVASLHRALESTYVFKNKLTPQTAKTNSTQYPLNGSAGAPPAPPTFATRGAPPTTSADASFAAANAAGQVPSGAEVPAGAEGAALAGLLGLPQEGGSAPSSSPQQAKRPFEPHEGERAGPRVRYCYELTKCLGVGASGQVYECIQRDVQNNLKPLRVVAAKLVRNTPAHICNGLNELIIYQVMPKREGSRSVIEHLEFFVYRRHLCFILEILQTDLYQVLKAGKFKGLPLPCVQSIAAQIVGTLRVATDARITHFDLKPENILITLDEEETNTNLPNSKPTQGDHAGHLGASSAAREASAETDSSLFLDAAVPLGGDVPPALKYNNLKSARVKVIDFSASRLWMHRGFPRAAGKEEHVQYVKDIVSAARCTTCYRIQTRYYGAPELLLGIPYYKVVDVWSVGCILAELVLGVPLFPGVSHFDLLRRITRICGSVPTWMLDHGSRVWKFYARDVVLSLPPTLGPPGVAEETAESAEDLKLLQHEETKQDASPSVPRSPTAWQEASPLGGGHSLLPVGGVTLCGPVNSASCKEGASGRSALSHAARGTSSRFSVAGPSAGLREAFGPARDRRGLCSRAVSEALEAEGDETRACFLNSRAAAALQLVRCFDRATEGGDCRCRLPRTALGGNSSSIFCERNGEDRGVGLGRATVAFSGVDGDRTSDREERETALGWRMLSIAEYEQKHNKVEPKTADLLNIREIRDVLRVRAENIRSFRGPCAACTRLARPAADLAAGAPDGAHAAADAPEEAAAPCADADGDKNVECSSCRDTRIQEDCLAADFLDFLERALVIDPLLRMTPEEAAAHPFVFRLGTSLDGEAPRRPRQSWGERQLNRVLCFMQEQLEALQQQQQAGLTATTHIASPLRLPLQLWKPQTFPCDWSGRDPPAAAAAAALQQQQQQQQLQESNGCTELPAFAGEAFGSPVQLGGIYSPSMALRCSSPLCLGSPPLVTLGGTSPRTGGLYAAGSPAVLPHSSPPLLALGSPATAFAAPYPHQIDPAAAHLLRAATTADLPMQQQQHLLMMRCSTPQQRMRSFLAQQQQLELLHQQQQQQQQQQHGTWKRGNLQQYHMSSGRPSLATRRNHRLESPRLLGSPLHAVGHEPQRSHWGRPPEGASVMPSAAWPGMGAAVAGGGPWADTHTNYSLTPERVSSQQQQQQQWEERNPRQSQCSMPLP